MADAASKDRLRELSEYFRNVGGGSSESPAPIRNINHMARPADYQQDMDTMDPVFRQMVLDEAHKNYERQQSPVIPQAVVPQFPNLRSAFAAPGQPLPPAPSQPQGAVELSEDPEEQLRQIQAAHQGR